MEALGQTGRIREQNWEHRSRWGSKEAALAKLRQTRGTWEWHGRALGQMDGLREQLWEHWGSGGFSGAGVTLRVCRMTLGAALCQ